MPSDNVPEPYRHEVATWQRIVQGVAKEEMGHLMTVQNVLPDSTWALTRT